MVTNIAERLFGRFARDERRGQAMLEYALILTLMVILLIVVLTVMGNTVKNMFCNVTGSLNT